MRQKLRWNAYLHKLTFDYSKPVGGLGVDRYGEPKRFRNLNGEKYDEIAVMIGDFSGVEDPVAQKTLDAVKHARPACLDVEKNKELDQTFAELRHLQRKLQQALVKDPDRKSRGPMGHAFLTRNPLLPEEMFVSKGLEPFVVEMNQDLEFSLLKNPKRYTVRIASFRGVDTMNPAKFEELTNKKRSMSKIDEAAQNAHKLVEHLRKQGVDAYEFHDVTESIVCVGGFDEVGKPRADGRTEINPAIHRLLQQYGPPNPTAGMTSTGAVQPRIMAGLPLDFQPLPVEVPRVSIGTQFAKTAPRK
jgi:hypothetical protein